MVDNSDESVPSLLNDILVALKIISMIEVGVKLNIKSLSFTSSYSLFGTIYRYLNGENRVNLMAYLNQIIYRTIHALSEYVKFRELIVVNLFNAKKGMLNLMETYRNDPNIVAQLQVLISNIEIYLEKHSNLIPVD